MNHLFFECKIAVQVWKRVANWLGVNESDHREPLDHFLRHGGFFTGKKRKKIRYVIWLAVTWIIWGARNEVLFKGNSPDVESIFNRVVVTSWQWVKERAGRNLSLTFASWSSSPVSSLNQI